jgi:hypothetical protein
MKPTAHERFALKAVAAAAALILAMTAQGLPMSYLVELERAKIEPAAKLLHQECGDHTDSQACKEQRDTLVKALNGFVSLVQKELALLDANAGDADFQKQTAARRTNAAGPSVGAGAAEGDSAMSIPEGMIANNVATAPCRGLSLSR